ncbi:MAG: arginase [Tissierellia bacterium]|nr:arginase [Tissierellia bacterium]
MKIDLIGVPVNYGCDRYGAQFGPSILRKNKIVELIKNEGFNVFDKGDISIPIVSVEDKYSSHTKLKYLNPIVHYNNRLAYEVNSSLDDGAFPLVIGGDHSLGMGSIAGASNYFDEIAVIWIDAHGDINTVDTSPSGNIHGMPLAASMNIGHSLLTNIYYNGQKVKPENVYIIGARDLDPGEIKLARDINLNLYTMDDIRKFGLNNIIETIINNINNSNIDGVHLSFDIDALDKRLVPGTGTPVENGFNLDEGKELFSKFIGAGFITSMDFVELNPLLDDVDNKTVKNCLELLKHIFSVLKTQNKLTIGI